MSSISIGPGPGEFAASGRKKVVVLDDYEDSLRRTADWAWRNGLLRHPLPG